MSASVSSPTLIRLPAVIARTGLRKSQLYAMAGRGEFPKPLKIGAHATAWVESEVRQWIEARIAHRDSLANGGT